MKLSRTVSYAVQATLQLAESKSRAPIPCSQLAAVGQMPERFLLQILRNLVKHGILHSTHGSGGGYTLERRPDDISLLEVIEAIQGPVTAAENSEALSEPAQTQLNHAMENVNAHLRRELAAIKIAHLLPKPGINVRG